MLLQPRIIRYRVSIIQKKWANENNFLDYFSNQWLKDGQDGWFEGHCTGVPSTSNSIESTHRVMKDVENLRNRQSLQVFLNKLPNGLIHEWSISRNPENNPNVKTFSTKPVIGKKDWDEAFGWKNSSRPVIHMRKENMYFTSDKFQSLTKEDCRRYLIDIKNKSKHQDLDAYLDQVNSIHIVVIDQETWELTTCTCRQWQKNFKCKHSIAMCIVLKLYNLNEIAMDIPLCRKRKRGAQNKTAKCLNRQPNEIQPEIEIESDDEPEPEPEAPSKKPKTLIIQRKSSRNTKPTKKK